MVPFPSSPACLHSSYLSTHSQVLLLPFLLLPLCVSLLQMNNVDPLIVLYEQSNSLDEILSEDCRAIGLSPGPPLQSAFSLCSLN